MQHRARYSYARAGRVIAVVDESRPGEAVRSVTNDAERVIRDLAEQGVDLANNAVVYRDTAGRWDQLWVSQGRFVGFHALDARTQDEAVRRAKLP